MRKVVTSKCKYYFIDNGIRNAVISNFNLLNLRNDTGMLRENFFVIEKIKKATYERIMPINFHFWRTYNGQEIDFIEIIDNKITAYEIKWSHKKVKIPSKWKENFPNSDFIVVNNKNFLNFLL